jgi:hypothetical protein
MTPGNKRAGTATRITFLSSNENCLLLWRERSGVAAHGRRERHAPGGASFQVVEQHVI